MPDPDGARLAVIEASNALGDFLRAHPDAEAALTEDEEAGLARVRGADASGLNFSWRANLLRISAADLTGETEMPATSAALSRLADTILARGLDLARAELPGETRLAVIAMGKSGAEELNYVSDVDVVFVAEGNLDLATRQAARMIQIVGPATWPVDAGLRPEGRHGALVRTVDAYLSYLRDWARTWEFQALLKARPAAGDLQLGLDWLAAVQPLIWGAANRPGVVADIRDMRRKVADSVPAAERKYEIKLGPGGLRDIEFAVQLLQLVHGRGDPALRVRSTLEALEVLVAGGYLARRDGEDLTDTYVFLRTVEHRLQLQRLLRTHRVPDGGEPLHQLARGLGYATDEDFMTAWRGHATTARRLHEKLLYRPLLDAVTRVPTHELRMTESEAASRLAVLGFADPDSALTHIRNLTTGIGRTATVQRALLPVVLHELADSPEPDRGLLAYRQVSDKLGSTPWYLRLLRDGGPAAVRLARLLGTSRYFTSLLLHVPQSLRFLSDNADLRPVSREDLAVGMRQASARHTDATAAVGAIRAIRRRELIRIAAADLLGLLDDQQVGIALSDLTDAVLDATLAVASRDVSDAPPIAIIGMGRLGGKETGFGSDADVVFIHNGETDAERKAAGRIAESTRSLLAAPTADPPVDIDLDLRPEGKGGPIVPSLAAYRRYYTDRARLWERQALLRARPVAGDGHLLDQWREVADTVRYRPGGLSETERFEFRRVKARVDSERLPRGADPNAHTKLGRGGLVDIEWAAQLLQLEHGEDTALHTTRTVPALEAAAAAGHLDEVSLEDLRSAWEFVSRVRNDMTLARGVPRDELPREGPELAALAQTLGFDSDTQEFLNHYRRLTRRAHEAAHRIVYGPA
ncbi:bifunctional [glutamine synthetase] adenylyltransferase/[glutamine synthetase]-adenylyl-L-tyrosine phosphorylase [Glycomyces sp. L485]|uniref:bifunctional [glutamine synthetase] adenylyltransferase/[glutamine synthetase]-adenylyl-L-tyrosine phosphorylase n=1 Tax=Glycomyces sp. L485 TaxID=2909235 RepID=UPI001F4A64A8|nr:bifunctional [glutamine synthetase] adenylyltransferase/[glutamine synthetase]-adenylyl-L-tyrosine phosphorylase [Glycomyces sp. L485]MCH7230766.1 bifunctional [glutamine synthetase] adenylyltransferase/[glutamine synthetase]-adenylyl-L-tyrosine phosphorylase [Glycomyces sp. L485]